MSLSKAKMAAPLNTVFYSFRKDNCDASLSSVTGEREVEQDPKLIRKEASKPASVCLASSSLGETKNGRFHTEGTEILVTVPFLGLDTLAVLIWR